MKYGVAIGVLCCVVTCTPAPPAELPPIAIPGVLTVEWPWCDVQVPPRISCGEWGSPSDVGTYIKAETVCRLAKELKRCLRSDDWARIKGIRTCQTRHTTHIIVDLPDLRGEVWVIFDKETGKITCD